MGTLPDADKLTILNVPLRTLVAELETRRTISVSAPGDPRYEEWANQRDPCAYKAFAARTTSSTCQQIVQLRGAILKLWAAAMPNLGIVDYVVDQHAETIIELLSDTAWQKCEAQEGYLEILNQVTVPLKPHVVADYLRKRLNEPSPLTETIWPLPGYLTRRYQNFAKTFEYIDKLTKGDGDPFILPDNNSHLAAPISGEGLSDSDTDVTQPFRITPATWIRDSPKRQADLETLKPATTPSVVKGAKPWWVTKTLKLMPQSMMLLDKLGAPIRGPWDLPQVVATLRSLGLEGVGIVIGGAPFPDILDDLERISSHESSPLSARQLKAYSRWKVATYGGPYRKLSASNTREDLRNLDRILVWQACLEIGTDVGSDNELWRSYQDRDEYFQQVSGLVRLSGWRFADVLLDLPTDEYDRAELATLATAISPIPDINSAFASAHELQKRRPDLFEMVDTIVEPLRLLRLYGYLVSDQLPRPSSDAIFPERPSDAEPLQPSLPSTFQTQSEKITDARDTTNTRSTRATPVSREPRPISRTGILRSATSKGQDRITARVLRGSLIAPSPETLADLARNAETVEDITAPLDAVVTESARSESTVQKSRAYAVRMRSTMRQGVWARGQWDALTPPEMRRIKERLWEKWQTYRDGDNLSIREAAALALFCAATGFSASRVHCLRTEKSETSGLNEDRVDRNDGLLWMSLPGTDPRFTPSDTQQALLAPVGDQVQIHAPQELAEIMAFLPPTPDGYLFASPLEELQVLIRGWLATERDSEPRFTLARMHRAHQLEVLVQSGDVGLSQLACGDPLGVATTPTSYYSARVSDVQKAYSKAVERHGFTSSLSPSSLERVGSRLMLNADTAASVASSVCRRLIQLPKPARTEGRLAIELHREIVPSLALMFLAATTFRPTFRLGEFTATALCLPTSSAVIGDKISDEEHFARLVPLCPMLRASIAAYGQHLERLADNKTITAEQRAAATGALAGTSPLFFMFDRAGVRPLDLESLDPRLPDGWILPRNFLRHRTSTALRELGCPGIYVQALMGHLEAGLQPMGEESFMDPQDYLQATSIHLDEMLKVDGWAPLMGGSSDIQVFERRRPPLDASFSRVVKRIEKNVELRFREQRKRVDELRKFAGETITQAVKQKISGALPHLIESPLAGHLITSEQITLMGDLICEDAEGVAEVELRVEALREFLLTGRKEHGWQVKRLPRFHVFRPTPSVFHADFVPGYAAIDQLRSLFAKELAESKVIPDSNRCLLQLILALILWHGVADESRLLGILSGIRQAQRVGGLSDAIVVTIFLPDPNDGEPKATSEVLRGAVALAAAGARRCIPEVIKLADLQPLVSDWVPSSVFAVAPTKTFAALLAAAALTHRFESPPPLRAVWTGEVTSISISADRVASLMRGDVSRRASELEPAPLDPETPTSTHSSVTGTYGRNYTWLKGTIRYDRSKTKTFPVNVEPSSETSPGKPAESKTVNARRQTDAAIREETIERLEERLAAWPEDHSILRTLTWYAANRLRFGTPWKKSVEQRSVYKYVLGAGTAILAQDPDANLAEMDAEDFHDLYQACLSTVSADYSPKLADYLAYFHGFLVAQNLAPSVAIGRRGQNGRCFPDVGYVTPNEISQAIELLKETVQSAQGSSGSTSDLEAATAGLILGFASGARTGETLLRQVRELVTTEGRRALLIRRNPFVRVKTKRSARLASMEQTLPPDNWDDVTQWLDDTKSLRKSADGDRTAVFLDIETLRPMDTARLTRWITAALRAVTHAVAARPYWWRHTSASNDFLALMADDDLMAAIRAATSANAHGWLPTKDAIVGAIGSNVPLGQAHAAEFRSRRGHSRMRTSLETYIHVVGLIEPPGSRSRADQLSSAALGALAGMAPAAGRKRLSRAGISSSQSKDAVACLMDNWTGIFMCEVADSDSSNALEAKGSITRKIASATVGKAILRGLRTGELGLVSNALHLTEIEAAKWQAALLEAANSNIYGVSLPGFAPTLPGEATRAPRATVRQKRVVLPSRVDESWILACAARATKTPALSATWDTALRGVDPESGCIAVIDDEEFELLARNFGHAIDTQSPTSKYVCSAVVMLEPGQENTSVAEAWLAGKSIPLIVTAVRDFSPPAGWLGIGIQVTNRSSGKRVRKAVLLAALLVRCLRTL